MWRADVLIHRLYRGSKRGIDCVDDARTQQDIIREHRMSVNEYKHFVRSLFNVLCGMPQPTPVRHTFKRSVQDPRAPCRYIDFLLVIDVRPSTDVPMEVTFFRFSEDGRNVPNQIAHTQLTTASCKSEIEAVLQSTFG